MLNRKYKSIIFLVLLIAISYPYVLSQTPPGPNTMEHGQGINTPTVTTEYYYLGATNLTDRLLGDWDVALTSPTLDTGQGANELYDMDQNVLTTSDVEFNSVDATEFYLNSENVTDRIEGNYSDTGLIAPWLELNGDNRTSWPSGGGTGLEDYDFDFYIFNNATGMYATDHTGSIVKSDTNKSEVIQYAVDNLNSRGGIIVLGNMEATINYPIVLVNKTSIEIRGPSPATSASGSKMGATQLNSGISGDAVFKLIGCEGVTIKNIYFYTSRTDNWGILIDGTAIYPEHILIEGVLIRKFYRGLYFKNCWGSNVGGEVRNSYFSTTTGGYALYGEDLNQWTFTANVFSGDVRKGDPVYLCDGDEGRTERVDFITCQFVGANTSFIRLNTTSRGVGINVLGGNMETLSTTTGIAAIYVENAPNFSTITVYGTTYHSLVNNPVFKSAEDNNVNMVFVNPFSAGDVEIDMTNNPNVQVIGGHNFNVSALRGEKQACSNPGGETIGSAGTYYTMIVGQLSSTTTEARTQWEVPFDGYIKNLRVRTDAGADGNVTINIDGTPSNLMASWSAGSDAWYSDTSHYVAVSDGEMLTTRIMIDGSTIFYAIELEYVHP